MRQTEAYPHLLDAEHIGGHRQVRWLGGRILSARHEKAAAKVADKRLPAPHVGVIIDARRPQHPPRLAELRNHPGLVIGKIHRSLDGVGKQAYPPERVLSPIVLVDASMPIRPIDANRLGQMAEIVPIPTNLGGVDHGLNWGFRELQKTNAVAAFILNAGSHYATDQALRAGVEEIRENSVFTAFGAQLADEHASVSQSLARNLRQLFAPMQDGYVDIDARFVPADGTMYNLERLQGLPPFYPGDNPITANSRTLRGAASSGEYIHYNSVLSVQSGEALGPLALLDQAMEPSRKRPQSPPPGFRS